MVAVGLPHHITQRGVDRRDVFFSPADRRLYLDLFFRYAEKYKADVWGYCLMTNHVHAILVPQHPDSMARMLMRTHSDYARYFHLAHGGCGHLWQARYFSCVLDEVYSWQALAYVERNPVRAEIVENAEEYDWSSARAHCKGTDGAGHLDMAPWSRQYTATRWREALRSTVKQEILARRIREATSTGFPLGEPGFVERLEESLGLRIEKRRPGRKIGRGDWPVGENLGIEVAVPSREVPSRGVTGLNRA